MFDLQLQHGYQVHDGIRHLEKSPTSSSLRLIVHDGIRHLESLPHQSMVQPTVHDGIRHLENFNS